MEHLSPRLSWMGQPITDWVLDVHLTGRGLWRVLMPIMVLILDAFVVTLEAFCFTSVVCWSHVLRGDSQIVWSLPYQLSYKAPLICGWSQPTELQSSPHRCLIPKSSFQYSRAGQISYHKYCCYSLQLFEFLLVKRQRKRSCGSFLERKIIMVAKVSYKCLII